MISTYALIVVKRLNAPNKIKLCQNLSVTCKYINTSTWPLRSYFIGCITRKRHGYYRINFNALDTLAAFVEERLLTLRHLSKLLVIAMMSNDCAARDETSLLI